MMYLASPYHHTDPDVRASRLRFAEDAMHQLFHSDGIFSPICHNAPSYERLGSHRPSDYLLFDFSMLDVVDHLAVLTISGWNRSRGVLMEIGFSIHAGHKLSVVYQNESKVWAIREVSPEEMVNLIYEEE